MEDKSRIETIEDSRDDRWIHGRTLRYDRNGRLEATIPWVRITDEYHAKKFWFLRDPQELLAESGMQVSAENAKYLQKIWEEDWVAGAHYFFAACYEIRDHAEDVAKIIINDLSAMANELNLHVERLLEAHEVNELATALFRDKLFDKKHLRAIVERFLTTEPLEEILKDPAFAKADNSFVDTVIAEAHAELGDKLDGTDKMFNWFVGQIMRRTQGKADASYVKTAVQKIIELTA